MNILELILTLAACGFVVWIVLQIPMPAIFRNVILGVAGFALVVFILQHLGLVHGNWLRLP